jgi:hypothetical protein
VARNRRGQSSGHVEARSCGYQPRCRTQFLPPDQHDAIWAEAEAARFPRFVYGVERAAEVSPGATLVSMGGDRHAAPRQTRRGVCPRPHDREHIDERSVLWAVLEVNGADGSRRCEWLKKLEPKQAYPL